MPKNWGNWENQTQIGEGGGGQVFKVQHAETRVLGALKRLKNPKRHARFKAEVEAVAKLNHPGIVRLLEYSLDQEPFYAVYEYEPGGTLGDGDLPAEVLRALPLSQRLRLCEQICDGLHAAHEKRLIHRDVKPDNILISTDRTRARICDFGLVYCEDGERHTLTEEQVGSRYYMPPELEDGRADQVSRASDIYSMGKVIYYAVTGRIFAREMHRDQKYDLAKIFNSPHLEAISRILDRCITAEPSKRISSAAALKTLIEEARESIEARHPLKGVPETYQCVFCRVGKYTEVCNSGSSTQFANSGYKEGNMGGQTMVFLECENCGNCQRFKLRFNGAAWFPKAVAAVNSQHGYQQY